MGAFDAGLLAMSRSGDKFDLAIGVIEHYEELIGQMEIPIEYHPGTGPETDESAFTITPHYLDVQGDLLERLTKAKGLVREAEQLLMEVVAEMP